MRVVDYPGSCTAKIAHGFDSNNGNHAPAGWGDTPCPRNEEGIQEWFLEQIEKAKEHGNATLIVTTHSGQTMINRVLLRIGIGHSPWMKKNRHDDTELRVWYVDLHRFSVDQIDNVDQAEE